ncbi:MAG: 3-isopropylmalate dehydratase small subunit [Oscillospiraceae bacterium]|nr:3-isopropylmalate dehydratase small subunit [Oscillospiraceae bacterium]
MAESVISYEILVKMGDHIDTDVMTPGKYLTSYTEEHLASICLIDYDPTFRDRMRPGGVLVAGVNFGCGSSRETAPIALKAAGVKLVIAKEFARIFYRNALNIGLPCIVCPEASDECAVGDTLEVDLVKGEIFDKTTGKRYKGEGIPAELLEEFEAGGLIPYLKLKLTENKDG